MRKTIWALIGVVFWAGGVLLAKPVEILFLGNSFTHQHGGGNDTDGLAGIPKRFCEFAVQMGEEKPVVKMVSPGGSTLEQKVSDPEVFALINDPARDWDYVVLQEYSTFPSDADPVNTMKFYDAVEVLDAVIKSANPETKTLLYMTWARAENHSLYQKYPKLKNRFQMQSQLRKHYTRAARMVDAELIPVGNAWDRAFAADPEFGSGLYADDGYHQGARGACLNALVFYSRIYGKQPAGLTAPSDSDAVSQADLDQLCKLAWEAATLPHDDIAVMLAEKERAAADAALAADEARRVKRWLIDFGQKFPATETGWNVSNDGSVQQAVDSDGDASGLSIQVVERFSGENAVGVNDGSVYPTAVQRDSLFVTGTGTVGDRTLARLRIENLDPSLVYDLKFFCSRSSGGDRSRTARYTVNGQSVYLNAADNTDETVDLCGLSPVGGTLELLVEPFDQDGVLQSYGYLGAIEIQAMRP